MTAARNTGTTCPLAVWVGRKSRAWGLDSRGVLLSVSFTILLPSVVRASPTQCHAACGKEDLGRQSTDLASLADIPKI